MIKRISILVIIVLISFSFQSEKKEFSSEALNCKLIASDGKETVFKDIIGKHRGQAVVIEVWASWCSDCVKAMPKFKELQQRNASAAYVFISMDKAEDKWKAGIAKHELKGDHYWATDGMKGLFGKAIDLDWIPRYIVIDKAGKVVLYRAIETDFEKIETTLKNLK